MLGWSLIRSGLRRRPNGKPISFESSFNSIWGSSPTRSVHDISNEPRKLYLINALIKQFRMLLSKFCSKLSTRPRLSMSHHLAFVMPIVYQDWSSNYANQKPSSHRARGQAMNNGKRMIITSSTIHTRSPDRNQQQDSRIIWQVRQRWCNNF